MKNERHDKHAPHEEPPRKEKKHKEKRKKRGGGALIIILLLIIIALLILLFFNPFGWGGGGHFGLGSGDDQNNSSNDSSVVSDSGSEPEADTVIISIDNEEIYFDGELCADENDLRERIIALGTEKKYELEHSRAIKAAYDKAAAVLVELEDALGIEVNYNE